MTWSLQIKVKTILIFKIEINWHKNEIINYQKMIHLVIIN